MKKKLTLNQFIFHRIINWAAWSMKKKSLWMDWEIKITRLWQWKHFVARIIVIYHQKMTSTVNQTRFFLCTYTTGIRLSVDDIGIWYLHIENFQFIGFNRVQLSVVIHPFQSDQELFDWQRIFDWVSSFGI